MELSFSSLEVMIESPSCAADDLSGRLRRSFGRPDLGNCGTMIYAAAAADSRFSEPVWRLQNHTVNFKQPQAGHVVDKELLARHVKICMDLRETLRHDKDDACPMSHHAEKLQLETTTGVGKAMGRDPSPGPGLAAGGRARLCDEQLRELFQRFNLNSDGSLTKLELAALLRSQGLRPAADAAGDEIHALITAMDADGNGMAALLRSQGLRPAGDEIHALIAAIDADSNGTAEFGELASSLAPPLLGPCCPAIAVDQARLAEAFRAFDRDVNGFISATAARERGNSEAASDDREIDSASKGVVLQYSLPKNFVCTRACLKVIAPESIVGITHTSGSSASPTMDGAGCISSEPRSESTNAGTVVKFNPGESMPRPGDNGFILDAANASGNPVKKIILVVNMTGNGDNSSEGTSSMPSGGNHHRGSGSNSNNMPRVLLDSQAQVNCTGNNSVFTSICMTQGDFCLVAADGGIMETYFSGSVINEMFELHDVHFTPSLGNRIIISGPMLDNRGYICVFGRSKCSVMDFKSGKIVGEGCLVDGDTYVMDYLKIPRHEGPNPSSEESEGPNQLSEGLGLKTALEKAAWSVLKSLWNAASSGWSAITGASTQRPPV